MGRRAPDFGSCPLSPSLFFLSFLSPECAVLLFCLLGLARLGLARLLYVIRVSCPDTLCRERGFASSVSFCSIEFCFFFSFFSAKYRSAFSICTPLLRSRCTLFCRRLLRITHAYTDRVRSSFLSQVFIATNINILSYFNLQPTFLMYK